jgi:hypothetical protein
MNRMEDPLKVMTDLRPGTLDRLIEDGYARRRDDDLARIAAQDPGHAPPAQGPGRPPARRARPRRLLLAGGAAVTAAAAAAAVVLAGSPPAGRQQTPSHGGAPGAQLSARSFLLASAVRAAGASPASGAYWYVRDREFFPSGSIVKTTKMLFGVTAAATTETWTGPAGSRQITNEQVRFTFASAADKARWKAAGRPLLSTAGMPFGSTRPLVSNENASAPPETPGYWTGLGPVVGPRVGWAEFRGLPTTAAGLRRTLLGMWKGTPPDKTAGETFGEYLFQWADAVFLGPATPGTRAAMYRLLATQPGITIVRSVTDPLGRTGVGVADPSSGWTLAIVIDPRTAQELDYTINPVHANSTIGGRGTTVYEAMGWASQLGIRP